MYQTHQRINKGQKVEKTYITKDNIFAAFVQEETDREEKDKRSEYKQKKPSKETKKAPEAPQAKQVKEMLQTLIKESTKSKGTTATKDTTKDNRNTMIKAFITITEELKTSKAQQKANYTVFLDIVTALWNKIVALGLDNKALRKELEKSQSTTKAKLEEIEKMVKNTNKKIKIEPATETDTESPVWINPRLWSNSTDNQKWPLLPQPQNQSWNQRSNTPTTQREAEAIHFQERVVIIVLKKAVEEIREKLLDALKKQI
jgi:hypothetical protein